MRAFDLAPALAIEPNRLPRAPIVSLVELDCADAGEVATASAANACIANLVNLLALIKIPFASAQLWFAGLSLCLEAPLYGSKSNAMAVAKGTPFCNYFFRGLKVLGAGLI